ncbi:stealth family protein [Legionella feeleii]|uniref:Capsular polysaccharide phosphotransferase SacB n=1 Tax=Legionella feeleii TaxID=453 RepID=A0A378IPV5_9GAMM|nr:stealth family protein [Legionella feeleii]STX36862.1 Capsular polysaccharide phosphotransferase SacB [Legionella feeleii]
MTGDPIDAVITWVDGNEPAYQEKLAHYLSQTRWVHPEATAKTRFCQIGELEYCVTSLFRFAPWLRNIYIVTDNQIPALLGKLGGTCYENKVYLIDHKVIFSGFENFLPTFNSKTIGSLLWQIPGLSEKFIYFNDDCFLIKPVSPTDFFQNDCVVLRGRWRKCRSLKLSRRIRTRIKNFFLKTPPEAVFPKHKLAQEYSARLVGYDKAFFYLYHTPHGFIRSKLANYFALHSEQLKNNLRFRFRAVDQFVISSLAAHLQIKANEAVIDKKLDALQLKIEVEPLYEVIQKLNQADMNKKLAFICVQSLDNTPPLARNIIFDWLDKRIGSFESFLAHKQKNLETFC